MRRMQFAFISGNQLDESNEAIAKLVVPFGWFFHKPPAINRKFDTTLCMHHPHDLHVYTITASCILYDIVAVRPFTNLEHPLIKSKVRHDAACIGLIICMRTSCLSYKISCWGVTKAVESTQWCHSWQRCVVVLREIVKHQRVWLTDNGKSTKVASKQPTKKTKTPTPTKLEVGNGRLYLNFYRGEWHSKHNRGALVHSLG